MTRVVHISDLEFGAEDPRLVEALAGDVERLRPTVVAISGELTSRARRSEFAAARDFIARLGVPVIAVPGNHDIPLYNPYLRFLSPVQRFRRYVSGDLAPFYADDRVALLGLNTARSNVLKEGRVSQRQIQVIRHRLELLPRGLTTILVTHHPFLSHPDEPDSATVGRGGDLLEAVANAGLDLILAGHTHLGYGDDVRTQYPTIDRSILVFQAGTATSKRTRGGESNSYNLLDFDDQGVTLTVMAWNGRAYRSDVVAGYGRRYDEWLRRDDPPEAAR